MFAVLCHRGFRNLYLGQAISSLGDSFYFIVFMFLVKKLTGDDRMVGFVGALETLPFLIFGPYAGVAADRINRRTLMLWSDLGSGLVLAAFALVFVSGKTPPNWVLLTVPFLLSSMRVFFMPAKSAAIPALVPESDLIKANSLSSATQNAMPLISLSLSATTLAGIYATAPQQFFAISAGLNAASFFLSAIFVWLLPPLIPVQQPESNPMQDFKDGMSYVQKRHDLVVMIALLTAFRFFVAPFMVFYMSANDAWFGGKPQTLAWFEFSFFAGLVAGSAVVGRMTPKRPGLWFIWGLAAVGISVAAMAFSPIFGLMAFWNVIAGLAVPVADIPTNTYMQTSVPDSFRGRVSSVQNMIATGVMPLGMAAGGFLAAKVGIFAGFLTMGVGMAVVCLLGLADRPFRSVRMTQAEI